VGKLDEQPFEACLYVTSERLPGTLGTTLDSLARLAGDGSGGSHCLCVFDDRGHYNLGYSDEWADLERFTGTALTIAAKRLSVTESPQQLEP
jgi:hypothetical protein